MSDFADLSLTTAVPPKAPEAKVTQLAWHRPLAQNDDALLVIDAKRAVMALLADYSIETTPAQADRTDNFNDLLAAGARVSVTFLPGHGFEKTLATAVRLAHRGFVPVPHIAARSTPDKATLANWLERLHGEAGVRDVLVIAGGLDKPVGDFADSMQLLETGLFERHGIDRIAIAGHPEGLPDVSDAGLAAALAWKRAYAERSGAELHIVTQFCFEAAPMIAWDKALRAAGIELPIHIGVPGPATLKALLNYARLCGIGPSIRVLTRQKRSITKLMTISAPVRLVAELACHKAGDPDCRIVRAHIYPLGGIRRASQWLDAIAGGAFTMYSDNSGFTLNPDWQI